MPFGIPQYVQCMPPGLMCRRPSIIFADNAKVSVHGSIQYGFFVMHIVHILSFLSSNEVQKVCSNFTSCKIIANLKWFLLLHCPLSDKRMLKLIVLLE